jgi:hypothetical protein
MNAFGHSVVRPPFFAAFVRIACANRGPLLEGTHSSVWSNEPYTIGAPLVVRADEVICSILPRGNTTNVSSGSSPG